MYTPKHFKKDDREALLTLIRQNPLAIIVTGEHSASENGRGITANHIPVYLEIQKGNALLQGHIARANTLWENAINPQPVLAIFQGNQAYISPNWLPSKQEHGKVVPTWNYQAVHVKGNLRFIHDNAWKLQLLNKLTDAQESAQAAQDNLSHASQAGIDQANNAQVKPWKVSDAPAAFIEKQLAAIVGFEITVDELLGKYKLSQNQPENNREGIRNGLRASNSAMARIIR